MACVLGWSFSSQSAQAEPEPEAAGQAPAGVALVLAGADTDTAVAQSALSQLQASLAEQHASARLVTDPRAWLIAERDGVDPTALRALAQVDALLAQARSRAAELDERSALLRLSEAQNLAQSALAVPGAVAFYAEVELQLGITAAQAGLGGLAEASLRRAARLDPRRRLLAGEASPDVVALASRIWDEASSSLGGEVEIRVDTPGAEVFVDDTRVGPSPVLLRTSAGAHVLRVSAPGYLGYGTVLEVEQGRGAAVLLTLVPDPAFVQLQAVLAAADNANFAVLPAALAQLRRSVPALGSLVILHARAERAFWLRCTPRACLRPERSEGGQLRGQASSLSLRVGEFADAQAWLRGQAGSPALHLAASPAVTPSPLWRRWYVWSALALVAVGAGTLIAVAATPAPEHKLRVTIDPTAVR